MIITLFGKPGAGKSTILASMVQTNKRKKLKYEKRISKSKLYSWIQKHSNNKFCRFLEDLLYSKNCYDVIYSTDPSLQDTIPITYEELGQWRPYPNSLLILEEAGIGLSSRDFKSLTKYSKRLAAKHRHYGSDVLIASQSVDIDKAWRQRSQIMYICSKLGPMTLCRRITYSVDVDEMTHDLVDAYSKVGGLWYFLELIFGSLPGHRLSKFPFMKSRVIWRPSWYKYFDSFEDNDHFPLPDPYNTWVLNQSKKEEENCDETEA